MRSSQFTISQKSHYIIFSKFSFSFQLNGANNIFLLHIFFLVLFGLVQVGLQFDQKQEEGVTIMSKTKERKSSYSSAPFNNNGITNLADVACGKQLARRPKIVGGSNAYHGEFPWLVSIKEASGERSSTRNNNDFLHFCGGTILNKRTIMSAAHCFQNYIGKDQSSLSQLRLTVGEYDLSNDENPINSIDFGIVNLIIHPSFNIRRYSNDVALLWVDKDIEWTTYTWPACLVNDEFEFENNYVEEVIQNATVAGWGSLVDIIGDQSGEFPHILQKTTVPILSNSECSKWFHNKKIQWNPKESHICAGYLEGGFDSCRGDSGGPLMIETDSSSSDLAVIGIVAAGKGCGRPSLPGVYTRVSNFIDWITSNIQE